MVSFGGWSMDSGNTTRNETKTGFKKRVGGVDRVVTQVQRALAAVLMHETKRGLGAVLDGDVTARIAPRAASPRRP